MPQFCSDGCCHPEFFSILQKSVGRARHAVGEGDCRLFRFLALDDLPQPIFSAITTTAGADLRDRPEIEQLLENPFLML